jgi:ubiquinone/menaquinone biosynthesis C-methylase UbiE
MDYDTTDIASTYDRGRSLGAEVLDLWMTTIASYVEANHLNRILDLGCGTGRFSEALARRFDAEVIGIDPSTKMLEQARAKQVDKRVSYQLGCGEAIPLTDDSVDLIFMSMVFHHFDDRALATRECRRVLCEQGIVFLRTGIYERVSSYPYVDFFPGSRALLERRLPTATLVREIFEAAGFRTVGMEAVTQQIAPTLECYIERLSAGADSILASLSQRDFEVGMEALRAHAALIEPHAVSEPIDVFVFR